jgi:hypothetical protein
MKRDWELVRQILFRIEELGDTKSYLNDHDLPPYDADNVGYHMRMLDEAGLIDAKCSEHTSGMNCEARRLTWDGHEFLDQVRENTVWNRTKAAVREKGLALSFDVIRMTAGAIISGIVNTGK